jgi:hypothetical protein
MRMPLTWRLWRRLRQPAEDSPIYRRAFGERGPAVPWYVGCAELIGFILIAPMLLLMGPVYGVAWTVGISGNLAALMSHGEYDLLSLTPGGPLTVAWAIARATLDRNGTFANASARNTWAGRLMIVLLVYFAAVISPRSRAGEPIAVPLLELAALMAFISVDHVQSIVFAVLIGMLAPTVATDRSSIRITALAGYVGVQLGSYLAALLIIVTFDTVLGAAGAPELLRAALALVGGLLLFAVGREWLLHGLWRSVRDRLNADAVLDRTGTDRV